MINVALNKPALQSSLSDWSAGKTVEADASIATNGDTASDAFFHTDREQAPWWQVDLQNEFAITQIRVFNRRDNSERLKHFTALISLTGEPGSWLEIYRKESEAVFGSDNDLPFVITPETQFIGRFVRIRLDEAGCLHFRECEVIGYRPGPEEHSRLRAQTLALQQREQRARDELAAGRRGHIVKIGLHDVFVDLDNYSPVLVRALQAGNYEGRERLIIKATVQPTDRVLEIGTAIGVVTMTIAAITGPAKVATYDANPVVVADARRNFAGNGLGEISAHVGVMRNRSRWSAEESEVDFFVARDFWASRLHASADSPDITRVVKIPLVCLEDKIAERRANVLVCDIEGGEADLLTGADLSGIRLIVMETHYWACGRPDIDSMVRFLVHDGFNVNLDYTGDHVVVLDRDV